MISEAVRNTVEWLRQLKRAYCLTFQFNQPANIQVLQNLAVFCFASKSCAVPGDHERSLMNEGRREVWLHINEYLRLNEAQIYELKTGKSPTEGEGQ